MTVADLVTILPFIVFGLLCWRLRLTYRLSIVFGLLCLAGAAVLAAAGLEDAAEFASIFAFYFLAVGTLLALVQADAMSLRDIMDRVARLLRRGKPRSPTAAEAHPLGKTQGPPP